MKAEFDVYVKSSMVVDGAVGWGVVIHTPHGEIWERLGTVSSLEDVTAMRSTLLGITQALDTLPASCLVTIYTDVEYIADGFNKWLEGWLRRGGRRPGKGGKRSVVHWDLWQRLAAAREEHDLRIVWTKLGAERVRCAELAKRGRNGETCFHREVGSPRPASEPS